MIENDIKPWIFNTVPGIRDLTPIEVIHMATWVKFNIIPLFKNAEFRPIGSFGKKFNDKSSSDLDIALSTGHDIDTVNQILVDNGYETKKNLGFNQISIPIPVNFIDRQGFAQVDFMLTSNINWTNFIYHSPDFTKNESTYKGVVRTLLLMSILSESSRTILSKDENGNTLKVESKVIRLPYGVYSTQRSFIGKRGLLKKPKLLSEFDRKITDDPNEVAKLILGEQYAPRDCNSFESIWNIINNEKFVHYQHLDLIIEKFKQRLDINNLKYPREFLNLV
jgi:hypothetical protein